MGIISTKAKIRQTSLKPKQPKNKNGKASTAIASWKDIAFESQQLRVKAYRNYSLFMCRVRSITGTSYRTELYLRVHPNPVLKIENRKPTLLGEIDSGVFKINARLLKYTELGGKKARVIDRIAAYLQDKHLIDHCHTYAKHNS